MPQMLLFPDPRPLVERLGSEFFRRLPQQPGVYLMRDAADIVVYVGKAKNLRRRLASYRVANSERSACRHLRLLRVVARIEVQICDTEDAALAREAGLLRSLRPRFNRAGTWAAPPRPLGWRFSEPGLDLAVRETFDASWHSTGPMGAGSFALRASLVRLLWSAIHPERGLTGMPDGWFRGRRAEIVTIPRHAANPVRFTQAETLLRGLLESGVSDPFIAWIREGFPKAHPFDLAVCEADLERIEEFSRGMEKRSAWGNHSIGGNAQAVERGLHAAGSTEFQTRQDSV
jgi:predicted GIY-YIG superfamily endonuclease